MQVPPWQVSPWVQAFPSSQPVPFGFAGLLQRPVAGLQVPAVWHWSRAVQVTPAQRLTQVLFWQRPETQWLPHPPQLFGSVLRVTQALLQQLWPWPQHAAQFVAVLQFCPLEQQATVPPGAMQGVRPESLQAPQVFTQF
jgi:hypothetical protein